MNPKSPDFSETGADLAHCVRQCVEAYLTRLDGHPPAGLHALFLEEAESALIGAVWLACARNLTRTAAALGLSRGTLRKKLATYGLE